MRVTERITFGTDVRRALSGADLYVRLFQISSVLPLLYIFAATGEPRVLGHPGVLSVLFDAGISAVPRGESLFLSWLYRQTSSEVYVYFALLIGALLLGILGNRCFRDNHTSGEQTRLVFAALIAIDLILRLLPFSWNASFGLPAAIFGFAVRLACLTLIILDLRANHKSTVIK